MIASDDPGRLARDAYTYVPVLIIGGIVATAAANNLLIAEASKNRLTAPIQPLEAGEWLNRR